MDDARTYEHGETTGTGKVTGQEDQEDTVGDHGQTVQVQGQEAPAATAAVAPTPAPATAAPAPAAAAAAPVAFAAPVASAAPPSPSSLAIEDAADVLGNLWQAE
ncbi:unnamed protein product [Closterium sp. NIES-54]